MRDLVEWIGTTMDVTEAAQARIELEKAFEESSYSYNAGVPRISTAARRQFDFKSGNPFTSSASVETLMLYHAWLRIPSFPRQGGRTPRRRCRARGEQGGSLEASCRMTFATFTGALISCPQCPCDILINVPTEASLLW